MGSKKLMLMTYSGDLPIGRTYYKLDSNANDFYGVNNGVATGVTYEAGKVGNSAYFIGTGTTSRIDVPNDLSLSFSDGTTALEFSIGMWVKFTAFSPTANFLVSKRNSSFNEWQIIYISGFLAFYRNSPGGLQYIASSSGLISLGTWYRLDVTGDNTTSSLGLKMYLNGVELTVTRSGSYSAGYVTTAPIIIGRASFDTSAALAHKGNIDELEIYKGKKYTASEILDLYNGGIGTTV